MTAKFYRPASLNGRETALAVAVLFAAALWSFEREEARRNAYDVKQSVLDRWKKTLGDSGLLKPNEGFVTPELVAKRGELEHGVVLDSAEIEVTISALELVKLEFFQSWGEFCVATPGSIDWYGTKFEDVELLRRKLLEHRK